MYNMVNNADSRRGTSSDKKLFVKRFTQGLIASDKAENASGNAKDGQRIIGPEAHLHLEGQTDQQFQNYHA